MKTYKQLLEELQSPEELVKNSDIRKKIATLQNTVNGLKSKGFKINSKNPNIKDKLKDNSDDFPDITAPLQSGKFRGLFETQLQMGKIGLDIAYFVDNKIFRIVATVNDTTFLKTSTKELKNIF